MYDNLHLHFTLPNPGPTAEQALAQAPAFAGATGEPDARGRIRHTYRGLRLEYRPGQYKGRVRGSLHTFAQGNNLGTFAAADVARAVVELAEALALPPEALLVKWLEVGVNLTVPTSPRPFLEQLHHHRQSPFYPLAPPPGIARPLEYVAYHAAYRLKYYDKGAYAVLQGFQLPPGHHLLRFELVYTRARNLLQLTDCSVLTLADLIKPHIFTMFAAALYKHWHLTTRRQPLDYTALKFSDAALLSAGSTVGFWKATRATTPPATYHRNRARYNCLQREAARRVGPHPYDALLSTMLDQMLTNADLLKSDRLYHTCNQLESLPVTA